MIGAQFITKFMNRPLSRRLVSTTILQLILTMFLQMKHRETLRQQEEKMKYIQTLLI